MRIILFDKQPAVVQAWQHYFESIPEFEILHTPFYPDLADIFVSPANSIGIMDGGINKDYNAAWNCQSMVMANIAKYWFGELPVGNHTSIQLHDYKYLSIAPTMRIPMNISNTINVYLAARALFIALKTEDRLQARQSIAIPGLGTGVGKMHPMRMAKQVYLAWRSVQFKQLPRYYELYK